MAKRGRGDKMNKLVPSNNQPSRHQQQHLDAIVQHQLSQNIQQQHQQHMMMQQMHAQQQPSYNINSQSNRAGAPDFVCNNYHAHQLQEQQANHPYKNGSTPNSKAQQYHMQWPDTACRHENNDSFSQAMYSPPRDIPEKNHWSKLWSRGR